MRESGTKGVKIESVGDSIMDGVVTSCTGAASGCKLTIAMSTPVYKSHNGLGTQVYLEKKKEDAGNMLKNSLKTFLNEARQLNIGSESSSMNEGLRVARQNVQQDGENTKTKKIK